MCFSVDVDHTDGWLIKWTSISYTRFPKKLYHMEVLYWLWAFDCQMLDLLSLLYRYQFPVWPVLSFVRNIMDWYVLFCTYVTAWCRWKSLLYIWVCYPGSKLHWHALTAVSIGNGMKLIPNVHMFCAWLCTLFIALLNCLIV